jgi:hypothetical protein
MSDKQRIIDLQRQVKIALQALEKIKDGRARWPDIEAESAYNQMMEFEPKRQLQGICGHDVERGK